MTPFFSIIIPVYNVAPYLRECLDSVLAQTFTDWEAICIDDGSTDGSGMILDEYALLDKRFVVIHQINGGVSAARNKGIERGTGNYVCFVDGDDTVGMYWLEHFYSVACGTDIIFGGVEQAGRVIVHYDHGVRNLPLSGSVIAEHNLLEHNFAYARCFKASILKNVDLRFPKGILFSEDAIFNLKFLPFANRFSLATGADYHWRIVLGSASRREYSCEQYELCAESIMPLLNAVFKHFGVPECYKMRAIGMLYVGHLRYALRMAYREKDIKKRKDIILGIQSYRWGYLCTLKGSCLLRRVWGYCFSFLPVGIVEVVVRLSPDRLL